MYVRDKCLHFPLSAYQSACFDHNYFFIFIFHFYHIHLPFIFSACTPHRKMPTPALTQSKSDPCKCARRSEESHCDVQDNNDTTFFSTRVSASMPREEETAAGYGLIKQLIIISRCTNCASETRLQTNKGFARNGKEVSKLMRKSASVSSEEGSASAVNDCSLLNS